MEKWEPLNMEIRSWVISQVLRLEQTTSSAIRSILRMFKENPKTLGNQSSALSFKSKIDLLYDIDEIDTTEYNHLIKMMEIRNQFAHNHKAISFESFDEINPGINKYLEKIKVDGIDDIELREDKLKFIFSAIFKICAGKLLVIDVEYTRGLEKDIRKHVNDLIVENLEMIWKGALEKHKSIIPTIPSLLFMNSSEEEIGRFYYDLRIAMSIFAQEELGKLEGAELKQVFKQKVTVKESIAQIRKKKTE